MLTNNLQGQLPDRVNEMESKLKAIVQQYNSRMIDDNLVVK